MRLRHFVLTNFNVPLSGPTVDRAGAPVLTDDWLEDRMDLFERWCLPAMERRSARDAIWLVRHVMPARADLARRLAGYAGRAGMRLVPAELRFRDAIAAELADDDELVLTTRLDNDDALHPDALRRVAAAAREWRPRSGTRAPAGAAAGALEFLDLPVGYAIAEESGEAYRVRRPSNHFLSLLERRGGEKLRTARFVDHSRAAAAAPLRAVCEEPMWAVVLHARNRRSQMGPRWNAEAADLVQVAAEIRGAAPARARRSACTPRR